MAIGFIAAAALLALATGAGGCGGGDRHSGGSSRSGGPARETHLVSYRSSRRGYTVSYPRSWQRARVRLTPHLTDPREVLTLGTRPLRPGGPCAQAPGNALHDLGSDDALISVQERAGRPVDFPPRRHPFVLGKPERTEVWDCVPGRRPRVWFKSFRDMGRGFYAIVGLGRFGSPGRRSEVLAVLDSLRFFGPGRSRKNPLAP